MCKRLGFLGVVLCLWMVTAAGAANIIWVGEADDQNGDGVVDDILWPQWLQEQGYAVDARQNYWTTLDAGKIDALNQADLIIISRNTDSDVYDDGQEIAQWNAVTAPMIMLTPYLARSSRWNWVNHTSLMLLAGSPVWEAVVPTHPVFFGLDLNANPQISALDGAMAPSTGIYHLNGAIGNGTLIAQAPGTREQAIVEWAPGVAFFAGGPTAGSRRLLFCAGTTESSTTPQGAFNLTAVGEQMLINAIKYMLGVNFYAAGSPSPADNATEVVPDAVLGWASGPLTVKHDVYFGDNYDNVSQASRANPLGVLVSQAQDADTFDPAGLLEFGKTYYWRIDEVRADGATIDAGSVWSFTAESISYPLTTGILATASSVNKADVGPEKTVDGSGLNPSGQHSTAPEAGWVSAAGASAWIQYDLGSLFRLDKMLVWNSNQSMESTLGLGAKDVTVEYSADGAAWMPLGSYVFAQAPGDSTYMANTTVDFAGAAARYVKLNITSAWGSLLSQYGLSEVRFFYVPVRPREPNPAAEATNVHPQAMLSWRSGREAVSHQVFLSTDQQAVAEGTAPLATPAGAGYEASLDLAATYYWKVVELNPAETPSAWEGDVWSFSTQQFLVIDDFESYTNDSPKRVFQAWIDGVGFSADSFFPNGNTGNGTGSLVGYDPAMGNIMETANVHGGRQAMPLWYDNSAVAQSEADYTFASPQDWTRHGITTLVVHFCGAPGNKAGQVYVKINGAKVTFNGAAEALTKGWWTQWNIDLGSIGASVKSVTKLTIGVSGAGASGTLFVDDIRLYKSAPAVATEEVWIEAESAQSVPLLWELLSDRPDASGGQHVRVKAGNNSMNEVPAVDGTLSYQFTVKGGTYTLRARTIVPTADDNSLWLRIVGATTQTTNHPSGWVWWYDIAGGSSWHWDVVRSNNDGGQTVQFTLPAGTHTLEVAYREDGLLVDAFVITDQLN